MQVEELLKPFPIKEFHAFPKALMGPGAHELIGPEAIKLGFTRPLVMTSGLRGTDIVRVPLAEATRELKTVPPERYAEAEVFFG